MIKVILGVWVLLLSAALIGWGALGLALLTGFRKEQAESRQLPCLLLLGIFLVAFFGLVANFKLPLTQYAGVFTVGVGLLLLLAFSKKLLINRFEVLTLVAATVWVVWGLPFDSLFNDAAGYHLQFEQWIANSPVLWGLANIQTRFGFDSAWLIFVSSTRINLSPALSPWMHAIAADMMIRAFIFWWLLIGIQSSIKGRNSFGVAFYGFGFLFLSVLLWRMREAGTDNPANLIAIGLWLIAYEAWCNYRNGRSLQYPITAIAASGLIFTSKLSILPLSLFVIPVLFFSMTDWKRVVPIVIAVGLFVGFWILRNFILTGCFVYPAAITCVNVPWGLGADMARVETFNVTAFARIHMGPAIMLERSMDSVANFSFEWLLEWLKHFPTTYYFRATCVAILVGALGWLVWGRHQTQRSNAPFLIASFFIVSVAFIYWLLMGPDPRFSWAIFYMTSVTGFCLTWVRSSGLSPHLSQTFNPLLVPMSVVLIATLVGASHRTEIDPYKFSVYQLDSFEYRGVSFYVGQQGDCGDQIPCVNDPENLNSLDKVMDANRNSTVFLNGGLN